ncbi:sensor histidine kinase [Solicola sp. PLA-1-18]|uniref:sensor histidine kinase n=1 Tax=Solicola sp. PLA-1-18 TaxID=3380532 RepID=UPI003B7E6A66
MRLTTASATWAVAVLLMVVLPLVSAGDPDLADVPGLGSGPWWLGLGVVTLQAGFLVRQPAAPRAVLVVVALGAPAGAVVGLQSLIGVTTVAVLVAAYRAVLAVPLERLWPAPAAGAALIALGQLLSQLLPHDQGEVEIGAAVVGSLVQGIGSVGGAVLVAVLVRSRRQATDSREREVLALRREQAALVEVAVARERTAMARELHDIAAHHLSGIAVMTGAIGRQIDTDPEGAKRAVQEVRAHSRETLRDLRRLVVLLREDMTGSGAAGLVGEESLAGVSGLVKTARRTGAEVSLTVHSRPDGRPVASGVGPLSQLSAYRTVQEALVNAARHAPGAAAEVTLDAHDPARVVVTVRSGPARGTREGPHGGFGLVGMRERADLTGADLSVGPTPDGGWLVELVLPVEQTSPEPPAPTPSKDGP